ncbi:hypothetical protein [Streptomyces sp. NPDC058985]
MDLTATGPALNQPKDDPRTTRASERNGWTFLFGTTRDIPGAGGQA